MYLKVIACEVLFREICSCAANSSNTVDLVFTAKAAHENADTMRDQIQKEIDETPKGKYDAILLGYGLCGNGTVGLSASHTPLILPRAHDCCTLFLGSRLLYQAHFQDSPSRPYSSAGYMERGGKIISSPHLSQMLGTDRSFQDYAAQYGLDNAKYIMKNLLMKTQLESQEDKIVFIESPVAPCVELKETLKKRAQMEGKEMIVLPGCMHLIESLINGDWRQDEFVIVNPGQMIEGVYDWLEICRAVDVKEDRK